MFSNWDDKLGEDSQDREEFFNKITNYTEKELLIEICKLLYDIKNEYY